MPGIIEALHHLQAIERQLAAFRRNEQSKQRRIELYKRQAEQVERTLRQRQQHVRDAQQDVDRVILEVRTRDEHIAKHRQALSAARTNKEYSAILTTLNLEKADTANLETAVLERMGQLDELKAKFVEVEQEKQTIQERIAKAESALVNHLAETADERRRLEASKDAASDGIPPSSLQTFNRVAHHHDGEAMAEVTKIHPRREEYCCAGCNMKVSLEVVNTLHGGRDLQFCQVCGRILYLPA